MNDMMMSAWGWKRVDYALMLNGYVRNHTHLFSANHKPHQVPEDTESEYDTRNLVPIWLTLISDIGFSQDQSNPQVPEETVIVRLIDAGMCDRRH